MRPSNMSVPHQAAWAALEGSRHRLEAVEGELGLTRSENELLKRELQVRLLHMFAVCV